MRYIRTVNNQIEFIEANDEGKILSSIGLNLGEVYFQIKNHKVSFYLNDSEKPFDNFIWSLNIPLTIDGETYEDEDEVSNVLHNIMNDRFQEQLDQLKQDLAAESARAQEAEEQLDDKIEEETARAINQENRLQDQVTELSGTVATFDGRITKNTNDISALTVTVNDEIARSVGKDAEHDAEISGLTNTLNSEIQRALSAETQLHNEILAETNRAQIAESGITANLNAEIQNRIADVDAEEARAIAAESGITANLNAEIQNRIADVDAEEARALLAESGITNNLNAEISRSTEKDAQHDAEISALTVSLDNEIQRATEAENDLRSDINDEISDRISGDTNLQNQLDAEIARAQNAEEDLDDKIDGEIARANSEETRIEGNLNAEITRSTNKDTEHDNLINGLTDDLDAEIARATARENQIDTKLDNEIARATNAEDALDTKIDNEITRSTAKDASHDSLISGLTTSVQNEISRATNAENSLRSDLNAEIARAEAAEENLDDKIDLETQNRINAVSGLTDRVAAEEARASNAETVLDGKVNALSAENASQNVQISGLNTSLQTEISRAVGVENSLRNDLTNETSARTTADAAQLQRIVALEASSVATAEYLRANHLINLKNVNGAIVSQVDCSDFIIDGMVSDAYVRGGNLVITFNTDAGKQNIEIPISDIFDASNYYTKSEIDGKESVINVKLSSLSGSVQAIDSKVGALSGAVNTINVKIDHIEDEIDDIDLTNYYTKAESDAKYQAKGDYVTGAQMSAYTYSKNEVDEKIEEAGIDAYSKAESDAKFATITSLNLKQDKLTAGSGITITNNVISATGGSSSDLPLEVGKGINSLQLKNAYTNKANAPYSFVGGDGCTASTDASDSFAWGSGLQTKNLMEVAFGSFNISRRDLDGQIEIPSACTSFSIGGGSMATGRNNDFELRKNGDIYIHYNSNFVKLQDYLVDIDNYYTKSEVDASQNAQDNKIDVISGDVQTLSGKVETISGESVTSGDVQTQIDNSISGKADKTEIYTYIGSDRIKVSTAAGIRRKAISLDLPIYNGSGTESLSLGSTIGTAQGGNQINGNFSTGIGLGLTTNNASEVATGQYNISNTVGGVSWGNSGNTLFSVGNGSYQESKHNAFEVRENGDIYISSGGTTSSPMIKLQDHLGGGGGGGVTPAEVQAMIDTSISGKANTSDVYNKTEVDNKLSSKPNVWCGNESEWSQISGSTESGTIYLVY